MLPRKRVGQPADLDAILVMLASNESHFVNGAVITAEAAPAYFRALAQNRCIAAHDAAVDPATAELTESYLLPLGIGAMLDAPIWVGGRMVGVVCHEHVGGPRRWQFEEELLAGTMADFVARVIEASDRLRAERTLGQYRDHVNELNRVEQALRRSGENLRIVLGAAPVALVGLFMSVSFRSSDELEVTDERLAAVSH